MYSGRIQAFILNTTAQRYDCTFIDERQGQHHTPTSHQRHSTVPGYRITKAAPQTSFDTSDI